VSTEAIYEPTAQIRLRSLLRCGGLYISSKPSIVSTRSQKRSHGKA